MPHPILGREAVPDKKLAIFWILGALAVLLGTWIAGHVDWVLGTTNYSYYGSLIISFIMILAGGLAWIAVAVSVAHHR